MFFASTSTHIKKKRFFPKTYRTPATGWPQILGAFSSSRPTMRFFLSVHPCDAHFESQSLQASVDTFDSESGSSDLLNIFRRTWLWCEASDWQAPSHCSVSDVGAVQAFFCTSFFKMSVMILKRQFLESVSKKTTP